MCMHAHSQRRELWVDEESPLFKLSPRVLKVRVAVLSCQHATGSLWWERKGGDTHRYHISMHVQYY